MTPPPFYGALPKTVFDLLQKREFRRARAIIHENAVNNGRHEWVVLETSDEPKNFDNMVFICGVHRSGTTLIHDYLHANYDLAILKAPVPESEGQHMQTVMPSDPAFGGVGRFAFQSGMRLEGPDWQPEDYAKARETLISQWSPWRTGDSEVLLEKSPPNITQIPALRAMFPGAKFIIWTRHPVAVSEASKRWCTTSNAELLLHWNTAYSIALQNLSDDCMLARYEDFCHTPKRVAAQIAKFLNVKERENRMSVSERFSNISNSNAPYFEKFEMPKFDHPRIWRLFGY